ncbi:MAG: tetratricopeptide repeat protein [Candidatus Riflebacteria bacterium]|nr:tetratricopeptide repeat protein [Candidatus Riflebacteria bacterium]
MTYTQKDITALELELKKNPADSNCYVNLANAQLALNKNQQAFSTYRAAKVICPDDPVVMRMGAKVLEALGKREEAVECLQKALETGNKTVCDADSISHLAELLYNSGKKDLAISWLNKLVKVSDEKPEVLIRLAQIYLSIGKILESQKYLKLYKEKAGETREMYTLMGETMLARGFYDGAVKNYSDAVKSFGNDADMHLGLGKGWLGMGENGAALKELSEANNLRPNDINILLELGKLQSKMGMIESADETFSRIEKSKLENGECLLDIARYFIEAKKDIRAIHYLESARALSPFHLDILKLSGETYLRINKFDKALETYSSAIAADPTLIWAHEGAVAAADKIGNFLVKADSQKSLLSLKDSTAEDWCDYGETLIRLGHYEDSQDAFDKAAKIDPTCLRAYQAPEIIKLEKARAEGEKYAKQGEEAIEKRFYMTASERLEKALALVPNNPEWSKLLAKVALKTADIERASQLLSVVRSAEPSNFEVSYQLARTYEFLNNFQMSIELLTAITKDYPLELKAHLMLLRLKRCMVRGTRVSTDMLDSIIKNIDSDLGCLSKESSIPMLVKGYAYYIFSFKSNFQLEGLRKAEECFKSVINSASDIGEGLHGLSLIERVKGNIDKAVDYMKTYVHLSSDMEKTAELAKLYENFNRFEDARKIYANLREKYPENGFYRRKYVEMTASLQKQTGKNELTMLLSEAHKNIISSGGSVWPLYESAIGQELAGREGELSDEWIKRSLLSWRKAEDHPNTNCWVLWEMTRSRLKNAKGAEKTRTANSLKKLLEKNLREMPDYSGGYIAMARCLLAYNDLTNNDKALDYLEKAWFLDSSSSETGEMLAETAKGLGKSVMVDVVGYNVILSEPEIVGCIFKFQ